jgi:asparagine synthase (glutamine-hydrolysing)
MCGLFGLFESSLVTDQVILNSRLKAAQKALGYRGPDSKGLESFRVLNGEITLGHTRLSIIDLTEGGHQPMHSHDGRYVLTFNGEIYNYLELGRELRKLGHHFKTDSDSEVLLTAWAQWGIDSLIKFKGMFAFVVFDRNKETITLVRDAFGIKPLFYRYDENNFSFASEIQSLLQLNLKKPKINTQTAFDYLVMGSYDYGCESFYENVSHLLPGHYLEMDLKTGKLSEMQRWWWPSIQERTDISFEQAAEELRELFLDNIRLHLRSDVPLGAALSGGVDSSAVVCGMRYIEPKMPIHTFTYVASNSSLNEEIWADIVNKHVNAIEHKVYVNSSDLAADLDEMIQIQGEPFGGTSIYAQYRVFKAVRDSGITVTLDGQGADELLAGYYGYPSARIRSLIEKGKFISAQRFYTNWLNLYQQSSQTVTTPLIGSLLDSYCPPFVRKTLKRFRKSYNIGWLSMDEAQQFECYQNYKKRMGILNPPHGRALVDVLREEITGKRGLVHLLRHEDRNAMRWSVESRVPFLTTELAEFLLTMPEEYLISEQNETKKIFRKAMRGIVPDTILDRKDKIGFETPEQTWFKELEPVIFKWLEIAEEITFINANAVREYVRHSINHKNSFNSQTWRFINYCRWFDINKENIELSS